MKLIKVSIFGHVLRCRFGFIIANITQLLENYNPEACALCTRGSEKLGWSFKHIVQYEMNWHDVWIDLGMRGASKTTMSTLLALHG